MRLPSLDLLSGFTAPDAFLCCRLDTLLINDGSYKIFLYSGLIADLLNQFLLEYEPHALHALPVVILKTGVPVGEILWQAVPLAVSTGDVNERVDKVPHMVFWWPTPAFWGWNSGLNEFPLSVLQA